MKKLIENIKLSLRSKRAILRDLDEAAHDVEQLSKIIEQLRGDIRRIKEERDLYYQNWQNEQSQHAITLNRLRVHRIGERVKNSTVIPAKVG